MIEFSINRYIDYRFKDNCFTKEKIWSWSSLPGYNEGIQPHQVREDGEGYNARTEIWKTGRGWFSTILWYDLCKKEHLKMYFHNRYFIIDINYIYFILYKHRKNQISKSSGHFISTLENKSTDHKSIILLSDFLIF